MPRASEKQSQGEASGAMEDQGSQGTFQSEELTSFISSKLQELLSSNGVAALAARYDGRAGIASRKCLEVPAGHFGYAARVENGSKRTTMEKPMRFQEYIEASIQAHRCGATVDGSALRLLRSEQVE